MALSYNATATLTIAGASGLTDGVTWISSAVSGNTADDIHLWVQLKSAASCTANAVCAIRLWGDNALATNGLSASASVTNDAVQNLPLLDYCKMGTSATGSATSWVGPISIAGRFGSVPQSWGIAIQNQCGQTLETTVSAVCIYQKVTLA